MDQIIVHGGHALHGTAKVNGSKNAALPIMAACLLTEGPTVLHGAPRLSDVETIAELLRPLGVKVDWVGPQTLRLEPRRNDAVVARFDLVRQMRASICLLGPLLATRGAALMPPPGGCVLGPRPIGLHLKGLRALGARIRVRRSHIYARAGRLKGARVNLSGQHGSTVLGTANMLMAAALAEGRTVIEGAAREPEVQDLANFLNACGAMISGIGTPTLTVDGVRRLNGVEYTIIPDRIEAGTFLAAAALTGGELALERVRPDHMRANIEAMQRMGVELREGDGQIWLARRGGLRARHLATAPYPGFPTDMQPQLSVLLCLADGKSIVQEGVYPHRFTHVAGLTRMGARIVRRSGTAIIEGVPALQGTAVHASDLRAGAALLLAGLAAEGVTTITGVDQVDRGYQGIEERLRSLGAAVYRQPAEAVGYEKRKSA